MSNIMTNVMMPMIIKGILYGSVMKSESPRGVYLSSDVPAKGHVKLLKVGRQSIKQSQSQSAIVISTGKQSAPGGDGEVVYVLNAYTMMLHAFHLP